MDAGSYNNHILQRLAFNFGNITIGTINIQQPIPCLQVQGPGF